MNFLFKFINKVIIYSQHMYIFSVRFLSISFPLAQLIISIVWNNQTTKKKGIILFLGHD